MIGLELVLISAACSVGLALLWMGRPGPLVAPNRRGAVLPTTLGLAVVSAAAAGISIVALERAARHGRVVVTNRVVWVTVAIGVVFAAGLLDDLTHGGPRGLRGHFAALMDRRLTTGMVKVVAALGGGVIVAVLIPNHSAVERALGVVVMAGAANLWNGLDVAPGRAAKAFLLAGAGCSIAGPAWAVAVPLLGVYGAEVPAFWLDLRERAMLGDSGANALGFSVGAGLYTVLDVWGLVAAVVVVLGLNVLAETVTLSRAIDAVPPLRWLDRVGRPKKRASKD